MLRPQIAGVMWKTVSEACNLACDYCYYSRCNGKPGKLDRIQDETLEKFIKEYLSLSHGYATFVWQGGEPLLAGLGFFERVISLQNNHAKKRMRVANAIQTNGILINENWARFFKKHNFLVGVSLDGPEEINDRRRVTNSGNGSFNLIMNGIQHLREQNVDFNILTVIHEDNVKMAKELVAFYTQENYKYVQFIPCMSFQSQDVSTAGKYAITAQQYGDFLCEFFDAWYNDGEPYLSVRFFDNMLAVYLGHQAELCQQSEFCPKMLVLEQNGDAYPCDFFIEEEYKLGNVQKDALQDIIDNPKWNEFLEMKPNLPDKCKSCEFLNMCHGGCPRNRMQKNKDLDVDYFCESYKTIYKYAEKRMTFLAKKIRSVTSF